MPPISVTNRLGLVGLGIAIALSGAVPLGTADAAFPGNNGLIAFMSTAGGSPDIWVMGPDGSDPTRLTTDPATDDEPTFSPDGRRIAFTSRRHDEGEIYLINADGTGETRLTFSAGFDQQPAFSPDGQRIAFSSTRTGMSEIFVMNIDGTNVTQLTNTGWPAGQAEFSPDGQRLAFIKNVFGQVDIFVTSNTTTCCTTQGTQLTDTLGPDLGPNFSPDGGTIAFVSNRDGNFEIYTMDSDGTNETRITTAVGTDNLPSFSPDGQRIAFESNRDGTRHIYSMARDGSDLRKLSGLVGFGGWPDWGVSFSDITPPTIECGAADGAWHPADVSIACTASDPESGLADPGDASFSLVTAVAAGTEDANASTDSRVVCDVAGNCATAGPIAGNAVDRRAPTISIVQPGAQTYLLHQAVAASYSCVDGGSGIASCAGPVTDGAAIDTASVGTKGFTVSAADGVGNAAFDTVGYDVGYGVFLLYDPAKPTRRIKLQLHDANGVDVSSPATVLTVESIDGSTPASGTFSYSKGAKGYLYALDASNLIGGSHTLEFRAGGDPSVHSVPFQVR